MTLRGSSPFFLGAAGVLAVCVGIACACVSGVVLTPAVVLSLLFLLALLRAEVAVAVLLVLATVYIVNVNVTFSWFDVTTSMPLARMAGGITRALPVFVPVAVLLSGWHWIGRMLSRGPAVNGKRPYGIGFVCLLAYSLVGIAWSPNANWTVFFIVTLYANIATFVLFVVVVRDYQCLHRLLVVYALAGVFHCALIVASFFVANDSIVYEHSVSVLDGMLDLVVNVPYGALEKEGNMRIPAFLAECHLTGLILNTQLAAISALLLVERRWLYRIVWGIAFLLVMFTTLSTDLRGPFMGLAGMIGVGLLIVPQLKRKALAIGPALLLIMLVMVVTQSYIRSIVTGRGLVSRVVRTEETDPRKVSEFSGSTVSVSRGFIWSEAFRLMWESRGLGIGAGNFTLYTHEKLRMFSCHSHSIYFSFLVDYGWVGLAFLLLMSVILYSGWKPLRDSSVSDARTVALVLVAGLVGAALSSAVDYDYSFSTVWCYLALTYASMGIAASLVPARAAS